VRAERARRSLSRFVREAWPVVEPGIEFIDNWHIGAICDHLEAVTAGQIRRLIINVPPGHMKSLIVSVFWPAWEWASRPEERTLFASYGADLAIRDSVKCRDVVDSEWYRRSFVQDSWELSSDQNVKSYFQNTRKGFRVSLGVGGKTTGYRGDKVVVDDPLNAMDAYSEAARKEAIRWWTQAMSSRLNDKRKGKQVIIMQRLHEEDLAGFLLAQGDWEHLCLPTRFEAKRKARTCIGWEDPRNEEGELLFPVMFPPDVVERIEKKELGSAGFAGQHQQSPVPAGGAIFKRDWFKRWTTAGLPPKFDELILSWDCAFEDKDDSDWVVGGVVARSGSNKYLLERVRGRWDIIETVAQLKAQLARAKERWQHHFKGVLPVLVEAKANGPAVLQTLRHEGEVEALYPINPKDGKEARAHAVSPTVEAGDFSIPDGAEWEDEYLTELSSFPHAANDDQVDMTTQALGWFAGRVEWKAPEATPGTPKRDERVSSYVSDNVDM
jgi:predicted phage terminase large subunit-like protein